MNDGPWTALELLAAAERRLRDCPAPRDARARAELTLRNLRYYIAAGLVDRPRQLHGRVGLYDRRQLAQLIAIKRWQAEGWDLRRIAERLLTQSEDQLEATCEAMPPRTVEQPVPSAAAHVVELAPGVRLVFDRALSLSTSELVRLRRTAQRLVRREKRARLTVLRARSERA